MSILECENLTKQYGSVIALDQMNLKLESGKIVGLLGPNGSGKTTLIKIANRLLQPTSGELRIAGCRPNEATKAIVSYLPDRSYLPEWMKVTELLEFYQDFYSDFDRAKAQELLKILQIPDGMVMKKLSKGTKDKVQLILTMSRRAKVYLLDEPIAGVDPAARDYILRTIVSNYSEDALVLISTHLIADVESVLDEAVFLRQGKVILHKPIDTIREETGKSVDAYFREVFAC
jgi:ABC-2 type transport system ATP-binding protein